MTKLSPEASYSFVAWHRLPFPSFEYSFIPLGQLGVEIAICLAAAMASRVAVGQLTSTVRTESCAAAGYALRSGVKRAAPVAPSLPSIDSQHIFGRSAQREEGCF